MKTRTGQKRGNALRIGLYTLGIGLIAIAAVVALNLLVGALPASFTSLDASGSDVYAISDETRTICEGLEQDVVLYHIVSSGNENILITTMLEKYAALSSHIQVKTIDPNQQPTFVSQYTEDGVSDNSVIAVSSLRSAVADYYDIFTYSMSNDELSQYYYTYGAMPDPDVFTGETALTSIIDRVTRLDMPTVYYVTGNGEEALDDNMIKYIAAENLTYKELNLLSAGDVPEDASCVLLFIPNADLTEMEAQSLISYIDGGGKVILITLTGSYSAADTPNLASVTAHMGLESIDGIVCEADGGRFYMTNYYVLPTLNQSAALASMLEDPTANILMPQAHAIRETAEHDTTVTALLSTSETAYIKTLEDAGQSVAKADGDQTGTFMLGALSENAEGGGALYWYASPYIAVASSSVPAGNSQLFLANLVSVCGKQNSVTAGVARTLSAGVIEVTETSAFLWSIVFVGILPLAALAIGITVFVSRKKR